MSAKSGKNYWLAVVFILSGLVIGGLIGELSKQVDFLWWLGYSQSFGLTSPMILDLNIINLSFAVSFKINIASILGMIVGIIIYRKV